MRSGSNKRGTLSMRTTILGIALLALAIPASAQDGKKLPPGYILFPNAQGKNVPIKDAKNYAQCTRNGKILGYSASDTATYCSAHYPH
jgi:hypothetical protein